jgi:hypothetical protein
MKNLKLNTTMTSQERMRGSKGFDSSPSVVSYYKKIMNHQPSFISDSQIVPALGKAPLRTPGKKMSPRGSSNDKIHESPYDR